MKRLINGSGAVPQYDGTAFARDGVVYCAGGGRSALQRTAAAAPGGDRTAPRSRLMQGMLEESNVNAVQEMTNMLEVYRSFVRENEAALAEGLGVAGGVSETPG